MKPEFNITIDPCILLQEMEKFKQWTQQAPICNAYLIACCDDEKVLRINFTTCKPKNNSLTIKLAFFHRHWRQLECEYWLEPDGFWHVFFFDEMLDILKELGFNIKEQRQDNVLIRYIIGKKI